MGKQDCGIKYALLDGNFTEGHKLAGYCKSHHGLLTKNIINVHGCMKRGRDCSPCMHLILFDRRDTRYESALTGDDFRQSLGKHGRRKGERKTKKKPPRLELGFVDCEDFYGEGREKREQIRKKRMRLYMWKRGER